MRPGVSIVEAILFALMGLTLCAYPWIRYRMRAEDAFLGEEIARALRQALGDFSD